MKSQNVWKVNNTLLYISPWTKGEIKKGNRKYLELNKIKIPNKKLWIQLIYMDGNFCTKYLC